ncbi:hypothetical protein [Flavobacterium ginsenosidimutans]|uniref:hypothetical protein n=1 Tax=Flavobacterium ginsenosidimutans TaxID=687844 RepID=UPI0013A686A8|nr:hypothetical protein [Flavobacterium ginsenosidimutans]KAF2338992.1 hypothetical protein DM444_00465 [Flavobacterium ginsenosidimutans]
MKKLYYTFFIILFSVGSLSAQTTYIMNTNTSSYSYTTSFFPSGDYYYQYWIKKADGNLLVAIKNVGDYLIFNEKPTQFYFYAYRPETYHCSGPCGEDWDSSFTATDFNANCFNGVGGSGGRAGAEIVPEFSIISNQVLVNPNPQNGQETSFCDKVNLQAVGCNGTQRFFWEYRIEGGSFQSTNISTAFNETFQFNRSNYLSTTYIGNIDFRVLIDSDTSVTGEEVYSNIISYSVIPCPPFLNKNPEPETTSCVYNNDGKVILTFDRALITNERFEFNFYTADNALIPTPALSVDSTNKIYTFSGLAQGNYYIKYQSFVGSQQTSVNKEPYPAFTIGPPSEFTFEIIETQPACHNEPGKIQLKASGGESPYYYTVDNGTEVEFTAISNVFTLTEGNHYIKVRDKKNCLSVTANDVQI